MQEISTSANIVLPGMTKKWFCPYISKFSQEDGKNKEVWEIKFYICLNFYNFNQHKKYNGNKKYLSGRKQENFYPSMLTFPF